MVIRSRMFWAGAALALGIVFLPTLAPSYAECQSQRPQPNAENPGSSGDGFQAVTIGVSNYFICWGTAATANGDAITALTTVVIGVLTYQLAAIGDRQTTISGQQATFAETSAKTQKASERAYMVMSHQGELFIDGKGVGVVKMEVRNWGKSPGTVTDVVHNIYQIPREGDEPGQLPTVEQIAKRPREERSIFLVPTAHYEWLKRFDGDPPVY